MNVQKTFFSWTGTFNKSQNLTYIDFSLIEYAESIGPKES